MSDTQVDAKAGFCGSCRSGRCRLCASPNCSCPDARKHRNRPRAGVVNGSAPSAPPMAAAKRTAPVFELVKAEPPEKPRKQTLTEQVRPLLERLMADGEQEWHRIAIYPTARGAPMARGRLAKTYREFEWTSARLDEVDQSAIYVRWLGKTGQL